MSYEATMDEMLRQMIAPRRNVRGPRLGSAKDDAAWAESLDWQTNDYDFHQLVSDSVIAWIRITGRSSVFAWTSLRSEVN